MVRKKRVLIAKETRREYGYMSPEVQEQQPRNPEVQVHRSTRKVEKKQPGILGLKRNDDAERAKKFAKVLEGRNA